MAVWLLEGGWLLAEGGGGGDVELFYFIKVY